MSQSTVLEAMTSDCWAASGNRISGVPIQGFANGSQDSCMGTARGNSRMNRATFTGNPAFGTQYIYTGEV